MLFNEKVTLGIIQEVGDQEVILSVQGEKVTVSLSEEEAAELHQYVQVQENWLVPIHTETHELFLEYEDPWNEEDMEELMEISRSHEVNEDE
ncbi:hypothetical protein HPB58_13170 [Priestia filamentosa]|uniref:hypothetical protein n=1 Tax=Priestia filamentosa TaxID=1402861 RepID=UPI001FB480DF|nr:hypothetical protein [Priestia filamentosa]UOE58301.1 hypothetical protein HPB58_13170 [Priestia filamentosa]